MFRLSQGGAKGFKNADFFQPTWSAVILKESAGNRGIVCKSCMYILLFIKQLQPRALMFFPIFNIGHTSTQMVHFSSQSFLNFRRRLTFDSMWKKNTSWTSQILGPWRTKLKSISVPSRRSRNGRKGGDFLSIKTPLSNRMVIQPYIKSTSKSNKSTITSRVYSIPFLTRIMQVKKTGPSNSSFHSFGVVFHLYMIMGESVIPKTQIQRTRDCVHHQYMFQRSPPDRSMLPRSEWKWLNYPPWN